MDNRKIEKHGHHHKIIKHESTQASASFKPIFPNLPISKPKPTALDLKQEKLPNTMEDIFIGVSSDEDIRLIFMGQPKKRHVSRRHKDKG